MLNWQGWAATNFVGWGSAAPSVVVHDRPYPGPAGKSKRGRKPHRSVVEVDGELIAVTGREEAEALLERVRAKAVEEAPKAVKRALNKARDVERKTGALPEVYVEPPRIEAVEATDALTAVIDRINTEVARIYERAQRDAELALLARRHAFEQDEEEAIISLLLH